MDFVSGVAELIRVWAEGGDWAAIQATRGFPILLATACWLIPSTIIALGIGATEWRETPLAAWLGVRPDDPHEGWAENARDLDKDGLPDF